MNSSSAQLVDAAPRPTWSVDASRDPLGLDPWDPTAMLVAARRPFHPAVLRDTVSLLERGHGGGRPPRERAAVRLYEHEEAVAGAPVSVGVAPTREERSAFPEANQQQPGTSMAGAQPPLPRTPDLP